jgi:geranylgeranyl reductase family protein
LLERDYQVIIIGAGPAGTTLAYELASRGIRVLVLEKAKLPRYKCCGGGITVKTAGLMGIDVTDLVDDVIYGAVITLKGSNPFYGDSATPLMYTVMREKFDYVLAKRAESAGADILQGVEAQAVQINSNDVEVVTDVGKFRGAFVAGADGTRSRVARAMGISKHDIRILGLTCEVRVSQEDMARWRTRIGLDIGRVQGGYGWVFPKANHLSVGIACYIEKAKGLRHIFREYLDSLKFARHTILRWSAGMLPVLVGQPTVVQGRAILLGDAAGLADPLTGEGIYNAVLSAQAGATAIETALNDGKSALDDYSNAISATIIPEMKEAYVFSKVLRRLPVKLFKLLNQDSRLWRAYCRMIRGETDYSTIKNRISSLGGLYKLVLHKQ